MGMKFRSVRATACWRRHWRICSAPTISGAICSRVVSHGAQISVIIAFTTATLATIVSIVIGILTGYLGGKFDRIRERFVDAWMSFPDLIILLVVVSVLGPGLPQIIFTLGLLLGIAGSRIIRSAVVSVRENMYVHAAQSIGASTGRILWRHILPNIMPPIIVLFTTREVKCCGGAVEELRRGVDRVVIVRYDVPTAMDQNVEVWPENVAGGSADSAKYRFIWNFPLPISPHDHNTVYTGQPVRAP